MTIQQIAVIDQALSECKGKLSKQGPLDEFIHHNTLANFTNKHFEEAVFETSILYESKPYPDLSDFHKWMKRGELERNQVFQCIRADHIGFCERKFKIHSLQVTGEDLIDSMLFKGMPSEVTFYDIYSKKNRIAERIFRRWDRKVKRFVKNGRLNTCYGGVQRHRFFDEHPRIFSEALNEIHGLIYRCLSAYFDSGVSSLPLEARRRGLLDFFFLLHRKHLPFARKWRRALSQNIEHLQNRYEHGSKTILVHLLNELGISSSKWGLYLFSILKRFRGWAALVLKSHPSKFEDFCAVIFICEFTRIQTMYKSDWEAIKKIGEALPVRSPVQKIYENNLRKLIHSFLERGVDPRYLLGLRETELFPLCEAALLFHNIYKRTLFQRALDFKSNEDFLGALKVAQSSSSEDIGKVIKRKFTAIFCLDEREESFRRLLEEIEPDCETEGMAGHFGLDIEFQPLGLRHARKLCPAGVEPKYRIIELAPTESFSAKLSKIRHIGRGILWIERFLRNPFVGSLITVFLSPIISLILFVRIFFPNLYRDKIERLRTFSTLAGAEETRFEVEAKVRMDGSFVKAKDEDFEKIADSMASTLKACGLINIETTILILVAHGSESLNNPHEAAHDCGACSGGRGWPNARLFSELANRKEVRDRMRQSGVCIGENTQVIAAYHNTSSDLITFYGCNDLEDFEPIKRNFEQAAQLNARERLRRFCDDPLVKDPQEAHQKVITRSIALNQVRPEYGHATNAYLIIGQRIITKRLFMDRRSFLCSYRHDLDLDGSALKRTLETALPVCSGINLEYFFSSVDPMKYGCGTKTPHNINGLNGVMNGYMSDLLLGLPVQMTEIHRPVRMKVLVEAPLERVEAMMEKLPELRKEASNEWFFLNVLDSKSDFFFKWTGNRFEKWNGEETLLHEFEVSRSYVDGNRDYLDFALRKPTR